MQAQKLSSIMLPIFFILSFALVLGSDATPLPTAEGDTIDVILKPTRLRAVASGVPSGARGRQRTRVTQPQILLQETVNEDHGAVCEDYPVGSIVTHDTAVYRSSAWSNEREATTSLSEGETTGWRTEEGSCVDGSCTALPQYLMFDFGRPVSVCSVTLKNDQDIEFGVKQMMLESSSTEEGAWATVQSFDNIAQYSAASTHVTLSAGSSGEVGDACNADSDCKSEACDVDGTYGCQDKCVVEAKDDSKDAAHNCPNAGAAPATSASRYWRLLINQNYGAAAVGISGVRFGVLPGSASASASAGVQVLPLTADQKVLDADAGLALFSDYNFSWATGPAGVLPGASYVQPLMKRKMRPKEVGESCTADVECITEACDTEGIFKCANKCVVAARDVSLNATHNCPSNGTLPEIEDVDMCPSDGGSTFKIDQPAVAYVCCANTCNTGTSMPVGAGWAQMPGQWPVGGLAETTCTFWSKGLLPGDHTVCCSECWGSGALVQNSQLGSCTHSSGPIKCRDQSVTIGDSGGNTTGVSAEELVQCSSWEAQHGNWIRREEPCGGSCHHANGPVTCKDMSVVVGGDETMTPVTIHELATCAGWSSQGGGWTYSTDPCISDEPPPGALQVRSLSTEQKIAAGDVGVALFENRDYKWSTAPAGILAITTYVQPAHGPREQDGEVGDKCTEDAECKSGAVGACDTGGVYACENKCVAPNATETKEAAENCPAVEEHGDVCPTVGGAVFTVDRPSIAYVCCSNTCDKGTNIPVGDGWSAMDGTWAVEGLQETPCTFWRKGLMPGEHTVCCSQCWGSGALVKKEEEGVFISGAEIEPRGIDQEVVWARSASLVWGDAENTFEEAPHGVLENKYVRSNKEPSATPAENSHLMAGCPKGGGAQFSIEQPMLAYVCCATNGEAENVPGEAWIKLDGVFPLTVSGQCTFFQRTLGSGQHSVCCGGDWASGVFLHARAPVFLLSHFSGDGSLGAAGLDIGNKPELQITGDQTIAMWVKPTFNGKMTAFDKCYGGEGSITVEENGKVNYYYGPAGSAADPSQAFESSFVLKQKVWTHIAVVRDLGSMKLLWYKNGELSNQAIAEYAAATASDLSAMIGKGFSDKAFKGSIEQLQIFNYALTPEDVGDVMAVNSPIAVYQLKDYKGDGSDDHLPIQLGNKANLQLTGDATIATWIKANSLAKQAVVTKAASGEFSLTIAEGGHLVYSFGISGEVGDDTTEKMQSLSSNFRVIQGSWMHIAIVRDLTNGVLEWYINGEPANQAAARFEYALRSGGGVVVGGVDGGSVANLLGELAEFQIFGKALRPSEVKKYARMNKPDPVYQLSEYSGDGTAQSEWIDAGNIPEMQITGDQTIAMWIKATFNGRQNPYGKCYGGEGALQIEASGKVDYYYGTSGERAEPFQEFQSGFVLVQNTWTHIAVVRDLKAMKLLWYENGKLSNEEEAQYEAAAESSLPVTVGKGFTGRYFNGKIRNLRVYNRALAPLEVKAVESSYTPLPVYSLSKLKLDGSPGFIPLQILSEPKLRIEGDQSIMFWLQPEKIGQKMQIYSQCYGGEGSIMLEKSGGLTYSYGTAGARQDPYQQVASNSVMQPGKWQHVAIVRDFSSKQLRWYLDGELTNEVPTSYEHAKASSFAITIGSGPDGNSYLGKIAELRVYNRAVKSDELLIALQENSPAPVFQYAAWVGDGTPESPAIDIGNKPELQITGDQTIAMWVKPIFHGKMTPYGKCYGGEGSITVEENGKVNYYYGTAGEREQPYQGFMSGFELLERKWMHIAVVRDLIQMKLRWYVNGKLSNEEDAQFSRAEVSTLSATVGKGFEGKYFDGEIRNLRVYNRALEDDELMMETTVDSPLPLYIMQQWSRIDGSDDPPVNVGALPTLQITGDQTIAVWVKPHDSTGVMSLYTKASGGEGSLVLEANGKVRYSYGISGKDYNVEEEQSDAMGADPGEEMQQFTSEFVVPPQEWSHVTVVRDFKGKKVKFFLNGAPVNEAATEYLRAEASDLGAWVGKGQEGEILEGALYNLQVYNRALPNTEVEALARSNNPGPVFEVADWTGDGTAESETVDVGNKPELQITGDQTIAMWVKPTFNGRMNPFSKCYGGEGTITVEENGKVNYYYGTSGKRAEPFQEFESKVALVQDKWTHITIVRDLDSQQLRWYVNGEMNNEAAAEYREAKVSSLSATVGKGYEDKFFNGQIRNLRVYNRALQQSEVAHIKMASSPVPIYELFQFYGDGTPENAELDLKDKAEYRITGDLTIVAWVKPNFNSEMGVLTKCTGGEGALHVGIDGRLKYSYGTSGKADTAPIQEVQSTHAIVQAEWTNFVLVRDLKNMQLRLYINGELDSEATAEYAAAAVSSDPLVVGQAFTGRMFGVKLYNIALSAADAEAERWGVNPGPVYQAQDWSGDGTVDAEAIDIGNKPELQITGDQTIAMWMRPTFNGRMNPFSKCYGGEGTITVEENGKVNYYYGTAGSRTEPYQTFESGFVLEQRVWTHIAVVRDLKAMKLLWYKNGELSNEATAEYAAAKVSSLSATVGKGFTEKFFKGSLAYLQVYNRALSQEEISRYAQETTPTCNGEVKLYGGDIGEQWTAGFVEGIYPTDKFLAHGAQMNAASSIDIPKNCEAWLYGENLAGWEVVLTPGSYNTEAFIKHVQNDAVQSIKVTAYDQKAHTEREEAKAREAAKQVAIEAAKSSEQAAVMAETAREEAQEQHDFLESSAKGLQTEMEADHVKAELLILDKKKMQKDHGATLAEYDKIKENLARAVDELNQAKTVRNAATERFEADQQAVSVAEARRESTIEQSHTTAAAHKSAEHHEGVVSKHADKSKAALAEVQEIDLSKSESSTSNNVNAAKEQTTETEQQVSDTAPMVANGEGTVERVQQMEQQAVQTVKAVEAGLKSRKKSVEASKEQLEEYKHTEKLAVKHQAKVRTNRMKHEEEHSKSVSDAKVDLNEVKPHVKPAQEVVDTAASKLASKEEAQHLAAQHLESMTADLVKAQQAATEAATEEKQKKAALWTPKGVFEEAQTKAEAANEQFEQAKIVEGRTKRDQESARERGERAIKRAHDIWSDSEVAVEDAVEDVKKAKKTAAKAKTAPELIALAKAKDELAEARTELDKVTKEHKEASHEAAARKQELNAQTLLHEEAAAALAVTEEQLAHMKKKRDAASRESFAANTAANETDATLATAQRKSVVTSSDLQAASDKLKVSSNELELANSIDKAKQASKMQATDAVLTAKLKLQQLQEKAESAQHDQQREEVEYQDQRERHATVKQKHTAAKDDEDQALSDQGQLEKREESLQKKLNSEVDKTDAAEGKLKAAKSAAEEAVSTARKARQALREANAASVEALRGEHLAQTEEQRAALGLRMQMPLTAVADEANAAAKERLSSLTKQAADSETKKVASMEAAQEAVVAAKRAETNTKDAAVTQQDLSKAEVKANANLAEASEAQREAGQRDCNTALAVATRELEASSKLLSDAQLLKDELSTKLAKAQAVAEQEKKESALADQNAKEAEEKVAAAMKSTADAEAVVNTAGPAIEAALENYQEVLESVGEHKSKMIVDKAKADADAMRIKVEDQASQLKERAALAEAKGKADYDELVTTSQKQANAAQVESEEAKVKQVEAEEKAQMEADDKHTQQTEAAQTMKSNAVAAVGELLDKANTRGKAIAAKAAQDEAELTQKSEEHVTQLNNHTQQVQQESQQEATRVSTESKAAEMAVANATEQSIAEKAAAKHKAAELIAAAEKAVAERHGEILNGANASNAQTVNRASEFVAGLKAKAQEQLLVAKESAKTSAESDKKLKAEGVDSLAKATDDAAAKIAEATQEAATVSKQADEEAKKQQAEAQQKVAAAKSKATAAVKDINDASDKKAAELSEKAAQAKKDCESKNSTECTQAADMVLIDVGVAPEMIKLSAARAKADETHEEATKAIGLAKSIIGDHGKPPPTGKDAEVQNARNGVLASKRRLGDAQQALANSQRSSSAAAITRDQAAMKQREAANAAMKAQEAASYLDQQFQQAAEEYSSQDEAHAHAAEAVTAAQKERDTCTLAKTQTADSVKSAQTDHSEAQKAAANAAATLRRAKVLEGAKSSTAEHTLAMAKTAETNAALAGQRLEEANKVAQRAEEATEAASSMKEAAAAREEAAKQALPKATEKATVAARMFQNAEKEHRTASTTLDLAEAAVSDDSRRFELLRSRSEDTRTNLETLNSKIMRAKKATAKKTAVVKGIEPMLAARAQMKTKSENTLTVLQNTVLSARDAVQNQTNIVRNSKTSLANAVVAAKASALRETQAIADVAGKAAVESDAVAADTSSQQQLSTATENAKANAATASHLAQKLTKAAALVKDEMIIKKAAEAKKAASLDDKLKAKSKSDASSEKEPPLQQEEAEATRTEQVAAGKFELARGASMEAEAKVGQTEDRIIIAQGQVQEAQKEEAVNKQEISAVTATADEKNDAQKVLFAATRKKRQAAAKVAGEAENDLTTARGQMDLAAQESLNAERKAVALAASAERTGGMVLDAHGSNREASEGTKAASKIHGTAVKRLEFAKGEVSTAEAKLATAERLAQEVAAADADADKAAKAASAQAADNVREGKSLLKSSEESYKKLQREQKEVIQISTSMGELDKSVSQDQKKLIAAESELRTHSEAATTAAAKALSQEPVVVSAVSQVKNVVEEVEQSNSAIQASHQEAMDSTKSASEEAAAAAVEKDRAAKDLEQKKLSLQQETIAKKETEDKVIALEQQVEEVQTHKATTEENNAELLAKAALLDAQTTTAIQAATLATHTWDEARNKVKPVKERVDNTIKEAKSARTKASLDKTSLFNNYGVEYADVVLPPPAEPATSSQVVALDNN
jgi:hypothetical protein